MKSNLTFAVIILCLISFENFAQKKIKSPDLKIGIGYPYVLGNKDETGSNVNEKNTITGYPSISVEKPFPIEHKRQNKFSINPGVAYYFFTEKEFWGTEVVGRDYQMNHHSVNGYSKFLYQAKFQGRTTAFVYLGGIVGFHLITKTTGEKISYGLNPNQPIIDVDVNEHGKDFFGTVYYGAVLGFQPNAKITNVIKPSFEAKFYPGLVKRSVIKNSTGNFENEKVVEITLYLGLRLD